jgi:CSLREA domain-containing protein
MVVVEPTRPFPRSISDCAVLTHHAANAAGGYMPQIRFLAAALTLIAIAGCGDETAPTPLPATAEVGGAAANLAGHRTVNSLADPGDGSCNAAQCTLREAMAAPGTTDIGFASGLSGTITLAAPGAGGGSLQINQTLAITGPAAGITVRRRATDPEFRLLAIGTSGKVTLTKLSFRGGKTGQPGGGISNFGSLTLTDGAVSDNVSGQHGGGIDTHGPLTLVRATVSGNTSSSHGGGIDNHGATVRLTSSTIRGNSRGGLFSGAGGLFVTGGSVADNTGDGGIQLDWGSATLTGVRITGNSGAALGGGISVHQAAVTVTNSTISGNSASSGGGIGNSAGGRVTVAKTTIANNTAAEGAGIYNTVGDPFGRLSASVSLVNSTVSGNVAAEVGGGITNEDRLGGASVTVTNSTIAFNHAEMSGGGLSQTDGLENPNPVVLVNALVARNTSGLAAPDAMNSFTARFSLIGDGRGSDITNSNGNQVGGVSPNSGPIDPKIGPLAANGGPTRTHALLAGSPAIDAAAAADCPGKDQRGVSRPQGAACDIGSYERQ